MTEDSKLPRSGWTTSFKDEAVGGGGEKIVGNPQSLTDSNNPKAAFKVINGFAHTIREGPALEQGLANHDM